MRRSRLARGVRHPGQIIATSFAAAIIVGTGLLSLPFATESGQGPSFVVALFTATSAVCVTGHIVVDTPGYWSTFGELVILGLIQVGGLGIMTLATLFMLLLARRLGLRARMIAQAETRTLSARDVRRVVRNIVLFSLASEAVIAVVLIARFLLGYEKSIGTSFYHGIFFAISSFNNAGFAPYSNSLMFFQSDAWIILPISTAIIVGGLGFPVVFELARNWRRPREWSVVTRITVWLTVTLLMLGMVVFLVLESNNPGTLGPLSGPARLLNGFFASVTPRTAGFNSIDISQMTHEGWLVTDILMFIGGGSAGTAGGIKVTTFGLLAFVIWSELRAEKHVHVGRRRVPDSNQRQALAIALIGVGIAALSTFAMLSMTTHPLERVLFEVISALATVGLSTGITSDLPEPAHVLMVVLMFVGRVGPLTLFSALALRETTRKFELPEERTIVG